MALRVEEHFNMADSVGLTALQIGVGQVVKVGFGLEHRHALIIDIEEVLQIGEIVGGFDLVQGLEWDVDFVAFSKLHQLFGFETALQVQVEFGLWQRGDQGV